MKVIKKKMKKPLIIAILAAVLAVLIGAALIINAVIKSQNSGGGDTTSKPEVDESIGESIYANSPVAYPQAERVDMRWIEISGGNVGNGYGFVWDSDYSTLALYRLDELKNVQAYYPSILYQNFSDTDYEDLYAIDSSGGYNMPKLYYLCSGIGTVYFNNKFEISKDPLVRREELKVYGLSESDSPIKIRFRYDADGVDEDGQDEVEDYVYHELTIGNQLISGAGYYFMVDNRDYVYTTNSTYFGYAFLNYTDYINPMLVAAGLASDNAFEPYLTTDYHQWKNTVYDNDGSKEGETADKVEKDSTVVVKGDVYTPNPKEFDNNGYTIGKNQTLSFDMKALASIKSNKSLINALTNSYVGSLANSLWVTVFSYTNEIAFAGEGETVYTYDIYKVDAILTDGADITEEGTLVGENNIIRVSFKRFVNGDGAYENTRHGVIDLSSNLIPEEAKEALRKMKIGESPEERVRFDIAYTEENSVKIEGAVVISDILYIQNAETYETLEKVVDGAVVGYKYYFIVDGRKVEGTTSGTVEIVEDMTADDRLIAEALMGRTVGENYEIAVDIDCYCEAVASFVAYEIKSIEYFVTKELIVAFEYVQASERDPYYGESFYKNTMDNQYSIYALNASSCEAVVRILGGLLENATSSDGLIGSSVYDINITPEKLKALGLYANTIYFELPRYITTVTTGAATGNVEDYLTNLDDYSYYGTIGFTLYISDADPKTGTRYIASDLYDVIAVIDAENFIFLDQTFVDFYARRNLVITDISNVSEIKMEFAMSDFYGTFVSKLQHNWRWVYNGKTYLKENLTAEQLALAVETDFIQVIQSCKGECSDTELGKFLKENGYSAISLYEFYDKEMVEGDSLGTEHFKEFIETLYYTFYEGSLSEEEQFANSELVTSEQFLMRMTIKLEEVENYKYYYAYEFYRISDRRVMVRLYKVDVTTGEFADEPVSDFYISTFAYKKLVYKYMGILNKKDIDNDVAYS